MDLRAAMRSSASSIRTPACSSPASDRYAERCEAAIDAAGLAANVHPPGAP